MPAPSRRGVLALGAAAATAAAAPSVAGQDLDGGFIQACKAFLDARARYDREGGEIESPEDPLWHAVEAARLQAEAGEPRTLAGLRAMAVVAQRLATQPDGSESWDPGFTGPWLSSLALEILHLVPPDPRLPA